MADNSTMTEKGKAVSATVNQPDDAHLQFTKRDGPIECRLKRDHWLLGANGRGIAIVFGETDANARRLVACWNACIGTPTEALESCQPDITEGWGQIIEALRALSVLALQSDRYRDDPDFRDAVDSGLHLSGQSKKVKA